MRICSVDGCDTTVYCKGFCEIHYRRVQRTGTPNAPVFQYVCNVDGCDRAHDAKGLCSKHYRRLMTSGSAHRTLYKTVAERIKLKTVRDKKGCLVWTGGVNNKGYGTIGNRNRKKAYVHRLAWELSVGVIPEGMCVLHKCDNPPCCEISHLFLGTHKDNYDDMVAKGRQNIAVGEKSSNAKLTENEVLEIRKLYPQNSQRFIAKEFYVGHSTIYNIVNRITWRHI